VNIGGQEHTAGALADGRLLQFIIDISILSKIRDEIIEAQLGVHIIDTESKGTPPALWNF
jgi:hypothetical protein